MIEVSEKYQQRDKGRKGRKRLQEIAGQIEQMHRDLGNLYDGYEEMQKLESLLPDPEVRLYFLRYLKDLDAIWSGVETYGLLRLCGKWTRQHKVEELQQLDVDSMLESLLPSKEWKQHTEGAEDHGIHTDA